MHEVLPLYRVWGCNPPPPPTKTKGIRSWPPRSHGLICIYATNEVKHLIIATKMASSWVRLHEFLAWSSRTCQTQLAFSGSSVRPQIKMNGSLNKVTVLHTSNWDPIYHQSWRWFCNGIGCWLLCMETLHTESTYNRKYDLCSNNVLYLYMQQLPVYLIIDG